MIPGQLGSITCLRIAPDINHVAVGTAKGTVAVWHTSIRQPLAKEKVCTLAALKSPQRATYISRIASHRIAQLVVSSAIHKDVPITAVVWDSKASAVFAADSAGVVSIIRVKLMRLFSPAEIIFRADSRVVQLSFADGRLLVSTLTKCTLLDTEQRTAVGVRLDDPHASLIQTTHCSPAHSGRLTAPRWPLWRLPHSIS